ncbi:helix-turn-helix transcriptional regulator [Lysobacter spongiae]|uniref:Helix-turn-helix transcriptional regulator n=2 Tax=Marilutibacter spongiae TaxID=2025720 RepID=A0A7W3Y7B4_9GAMM|nr:helix-turn-helix transcriptional regulator [Lysobacter spongiae]
MTMTLGERLTHARVESGYNEPAIAAHKAGISPSALYQLEDGTTKSLKGTTAVQLGRVYTDFRIEWLIDGSGPAKRERIGVADEPATYVAGSETPVGYVRLPLLNMEGDMGYGTYSDEQPDVVKFLDVAEWWARQNLPRDLDRVKLISSRGDSMAGVINHGDVVFVDTGIDHYEGEGIYVFNWQGRALIKRLVPNLRTGRLQIQSANPAYPPEDVAPEEIEQLHIAGRVAAWWTLRNF